jgi:TPR repeat protein
MAKKSDQSASVFDEANEAWDIGDKRRAFNLFLTAARNGEKEAFNSIGYFFYHGIAVKKDRRTAYAWYRRAAMRGDLAAYLNLGSWFRESGNLRRSKFWFEKACALGDGSAAYELGKIYAEQRGRSNDARALQYLTAAIASKYIDEDERSKARELLSRLRRQIKPDPQC